MRLKDDWRCAVADIQKVSIALTGGQLAALKAAVEAGEYATTSEIVREAVRDWQFKRELRQEEVKRLRKLWDEGKASGPAEPFDVERTLAAARARLKEVKAL
jgi:antitoxin ParD1/3/4